MFIYLKKIRLHRSIPIPVQLEDDSTIYDNPIPVDFSNRFISAIQHKRGVLITNETEAYLRSDPKLLCTCQSTTLLMGQQVTQTSPYQYQTTSMLNPPLFRKSDPPAGSFSVTSIVPADQALLYRLSGDYNALHADAAMGFEEQSRSPILHGLCTMGFAVRAVFKYFKSIHSVSEANLTYVQCDFVRPVHMGDAITVSAWEEGGYSEKDSALISFLVSKANENRMLARGVVQIQKKIEEDRHHQQAITQSKL